MLNYQRVVCHKYPQLPPPVPDISSPPPQGVPCFGAPSRLGSGASGYQVTRFKHRNEDWPTAYGLLSLNIHKWINNDKHI